MSLKSFVLATLEVPASGLQVSCTSPLVADPNSEEGGSVCALPCPSFIYSTNEYMPIMLALPLPGIWGAFGNVYMV